MKEPLVAESPSDLPERRTTILVTQDRELTLPRPSPSPFPPNLISTCKYNCATFLPKNLWEQFHKLANVYFLAASVLQCLPDITTSGGVPSILLPLILVLIVSGIKDLLEDLKRRKSDNEENAKLVRCRQQRMWVETPWRELCVGDVVKVHSGDNFPADLILLSTSDPAGIAYVETKSLDGETNLKHKQADKTLQTRYSDDSAIDSIALRVKCQAPNPFIYEFSGLLIEDDDVPKALTYSHMLLRGSGLRNTDWVIGICVYTGHETKIMLNSPKSRAKYSKVEQQMNLQIIYIFLLQTLICIIAAIFNLCWFWQYETETDQYLKLNSSNQDMVVVFVISFFSWMLIFTNFVPISLIVTLEMVKFFQAIFVGWDINMYWEETNMPAAVQSSNLIEELGQITYVFSDKTGTLTQNVMDFRRLSIKGEAFGSDNRMDADSKQAHVDFVDPEFMGKLREKEVMEFMVFLATCHTLIADRKEDGEIEYKASSPDELALVHGAAYFGVKFLGRDKDQNVLLEVHNAPVTIRILNIIEFTSDRKRMTVIAQYPNEEIRVLCKGADAMLLPRCLAAPYTELTLRQLEDFATTGLRTLVYAWKPLETQEYEAWNQDYVEAMSDINNRDERIAQLAEILETELTLLGASAIEDKLQDQVPETISKLREAGIKVWVLTGDKVETAINIASACALLTREMGNVQVDGKHTSDVQMQLADGMKAIASEPETDFALVVTGEALLKALTPGLCKEFVKLADKCVAVLACRVSPQQKADIVSQVKASSPSVRTLGIGDGANDVGMITAAHVGVGLAGKEGQQAVRASDFAISQFSFLQRLLFVHGRECYRRNASLICYNFYKNVLLVMPLFWFGFLSVFSGQGVYNTWLWQLFNVLYAALPIILYAVFDREHEAKELLENPTYYQVGMRDQLFRVSIFWLWILEAGLQSVFLTLLVFFSLCYYSGDSSGRTETLWVAGVELFGLIVVFANIRVLMLSTLHYHFTLFFIGLSILVYYLTSALVIEWMPAAEWLDNWDMKGSNARVFLNPNAYSCAVLAIVSMFMMFPMSRAMLQLTPVLKQSGIHLLPTRKQSLYAMFRTA